MKSARVLPQLLVASLVVAAGLNARAAEPKIVPPREGNSETVQLFNGKNLDGWIGNMDLWSVENGEIVGHNTKPVKVSTYLLTKRKFSDFRLVAEGKLVKSETHTGFAFWGRIAPEHKDPFTYAGHLVMFPSGWGLYDLYGRSSLSVDTAPGRKVGHQHGWNLIEILAQGNRIRVAANGKQIVDWYDPKPERIKVGPIGLQLHQNSKDLEEVRFRDLTLTTFPEDKLITVKP
jgi:Domain of Unknown Function (DUF1080)